MSGSGTVGVQRRRSLREIERVVGEYEQSGLGRKQFCTGRGLKVGTLDAWRRRVGQARGAEGIVPVELVRDVERKHGSSQVSASKQSALMRVVLGNGVGVEVEPGFDAAELRRLIGLLHESPERLPWMV